MIREDINANSGNFKGKLFIVFFRMSNFFYRQGIILRCVGFPIRAFYKIFFRWILGIDIPDSTNIGLGFMVYHGQGLVVHGDTIIGKNVMIRHNTTIGEARANEGVPNIKDRVQIGANSVIIGPIVIGEDSIIAAGAIVVKDVPPRVIVAGNPAKMIKELKNRI